MKRVKEAVASLTIPNGANSGSIQFVPEPGKIVGVSCYPDANLNNLGFVRARIRDVAGNDVSKLQSVKNYRNRETSYEGGFKPISLQGGSTVTLDVIATQNFTAATNFEFIFLYEFEDECND